MPKHIKLMVNLIILAASFSATGSQVVRPPIDAQTLVGTWEAMCDDHPPLLFHMEINATGNSYLAQVTVGDPVSDIYVIRRLLSADIKDGNVRLHFGKGVSQFPTDQVRDVWIVASGNASLDPDAGVIEGRFCICNDPPPEGYIPSAQDSNFRLIKGTWTRDVGEASRKAEEVIRSVAAKQ